MGRTNPTFRDHLRRFEEEWQRYRRGLRSPHQDHFDELLEKAGRFAAASGYQNPAHAYQAILLAIVLALATAAGFTLLFLQEPLVHNSLHNFRHAMGVTCH